MVNVDAETIERLELALARRDETAIPGGYAAVLDPEFLEIGASGRTWTRDETLAMPAGGARPVDVEVADFRLVSLGDGLVLATFELRGVTAEGSVRRSRRSSIWRREGTAWRIRFHQGTPLPPTG